MALLVVGAIAACAAIAGLAGGGAYLLTREDDLADMPALPGAGLDTANTRSDPVPVSPSSSDAEPETSKGTSRLVAGRYVQAGSFRSPGGAEREVNRLRGRGVDVFAIPSARADELLPGFRVLLAGPLSGRSEERRVLRGLERAGVAGFGKDLTPSSGLSGPVAAAGAWSGSVEQSSLRGARRPSTNRIEIAISPDGKSGRIEYPQRGCSGSLTLIEDAGHSLAYRETIESGSCPPGGVWHLRPRGAELTVVRLHDDLDVQVMLKGTVPALE